MCSGIPCFTQEVNCNTHIYLSIGKRWIDGICFAFNDFVYFMHHMHYSDLDILREQAQVYVSDFP